MGSLLVRSASLCRALFILAILHAAGAQALPLVTLEVSDGGNSSCLDLPVTTDPDGAFTYTLAETLSGLQISGDITGKLDPDVGLEINVTNTYASTHVFTMTVTMPAAGGIPAYWMAGSVAGSLTDSSPDHNGATLTSATPDPLFACYINGVAVQSLIDDPFTFSVGSTESDSFDGGYFGLPVFVAGPGVAITSMGIQIKFALTPGDSASFTSAFFAIPEPATLSLAALGLLLVARRRR